MKKIAKCVSLIDEQPFGSYTVGKSYEVKSEDGDKFTIVDDRGRVQVCWWNGLDPDCVWERSS